MPESLLTISDKSFSSRLIVGSGKYLTNELMVQAPVSYTHLTLPTNREV